MKTVLLSTSQIEEAKDFLKQGELVAIPTETVYGLAAPIFSEASVQKIFTLKNRPSDNPLIVHVASFSMVESLVSSLPQSFDRLTRSFWPGALTLILPKKATVPDIVTAGHSTVAIRMPSHPVALRLIEAMEEPLVAPSANLSGKPSPTTAEHVLEDFRGKLAAVLDGGPCDIGIESTVLSLVGDKPVLLRPGAISREQIEDLLKMSIGLGGARNMPPAPGMKYRHYAPIAPVRLISQLNSQIKGDEEPFILSREPTGLAVYRPLNAKTLYSFLREADRIQTKEIWVLIDPIVSTDEALMNRLKKAASVEYS
jgi:L-threonylcarbamoyladenylate synthase